MRAADAWAIERAGRAVARPDGARRRWASRAPTAAVARRGPDPRSCAARATTAATGWWPRGCCARTATSVDVLRRRRSTSSRATRRRTSSGCRATARSRSSRARWPARARSWTRCSAPASRASRASRWRAAIRAINAAGRARGGVRRALGRGRLHRRGAGRRRARRGHRHLPRLEDRPSRRARQGPRRARCEVVEIGIPRGAPAPAAAGLISERVLDAGARAARASGDEVQLGHGAWWPAARAGLTGAPTMAALAAQRAGAGYVQVGGAGARWSRSFELKLLEVMTRALPDDDGVARARGRRARCERAAPSGPARSCSARASAAARARRSSRAAWRGAVEAPLLIDADGLNAHAGRLELLAGRAGADRAHPARRRARPPARHRAGRGGRAPRWRTCATAAERSGAWSC